MKEMSEIRKNLEELSKRVIVLVLLGHLLGYWSFDRWWLDYLGPVFFLVMVVGVTLSLLSTIANAFNPDAWERTTKPSTNEAPQRNSQTKT
jgi:hypothetical protein